MERRRAQSGSGNAALVLGRIDSLPTLAPVAVRLLSITVDDTTDLEEISQIIEADPSLSAKILGLCRRAGTGLGDRITTVHRAVTMLGLDTVRSAVLSVSVFEAMNPVSGELADARPNDETVLNAVDRIGLWRWSIGVASASRRIAQAQESPGGKGVDPEEAFVAGLLHDLGKVALDVVLPRSFARAALLAKERGSSLLDAEAGLLPVDHRVAGKRLAEHWGLPDKLRDVMWLSEQAPEALPDVPHRRLIACVATARAVARALHIGWSGDASPLIEYREVAAQHGLDAAAIDRVVPELHADVSDRIGILGLDQTTTPELLYRSIIGANRELSRLHERALASSGRAQARASSLRAIASFCSDLGPGGSLDDAIREVACSAACLLGVEPTAAVVQEAPGSPWRVARIDAACGEVVGGELIDPPPCELGGLTDREGGELPAELIEALGLTAVRGDGSGGPGVRMLPLAPPATAGCAGVVIHRGRAAGLDGDSSRAVRSVWGLALAQAFGRERAGRLEERLAKVANTLARTRDQLVEAQSMVKLGRVASGAAHEMNTPLAVISGRAQLLSERLSRGADLADARAIAEAADHLSGLISSMHLLAQPPTPHKTRCRAGDLASRAIEAAEERTGVRDRAEAEVEEGLPEFAADREMVARALTEAVANALESGSGEKVRLRAYLGSADGRLIFSIEDKGVGMSVKAHKHAFDPFFSEKPAGRQTGLGLTRARVLIEQHGGEIRLEPREEGGTRCVVLLPVTRGGEASPDREPAHAA